MSSRRLALMVLLVLGVAAGAPAGSAAPLAYITNYASGTVSVIDTATNTVVAEVPNLNSPTPTGDFGFPAGVAVTPDGKSVYVTADRGHKVAVIDTATNTAVAIVELRPDPLNGPEWPWGVAVTPDGKRVYVANQTLICIQPCNITFSVSVIDTATNTVVAAVPLPVAPFAVAVTPDGKSVYVTGPDSSTVEVISTATNTDVASVPVGIGPQGVAVSPDGKSVYVAIGGENTLWVISTATTNAVGAKVPVGAHPYGVAVSPDGARVYVTNMDDNTVSVISTATNKVVTVPVGVRPSGVAVTPDGARVYVANSLSNTVSVIDTTKNPPAVAATVRGVGGQPTAFGKFITPGKKADPVVNPPVPQWFQAGIPGATDPQKNGYPGNFWAKQPYDFEVPEATIWAQGCAITALTMLANFWRGGGNLAQPTASNYSTLISPLNLNKLSGLFREPGGGVFFNNFAQIASNNPKLVRVYQACPSTNPCPQQPSNSFPVVGSPPDAKLTLDNLLRNNIPVILPIFEDGSKSASHFVVVTGKQNGTYSVNDPGDVNMKTTDQLQQSKWAIGTGTAKAPQHTVQINVSFDVTKYIVFVNSLTTIPTLDPNTAQALGIYSDAPVEFILTDPQGVGQASTPSPTHRSRRSRRQRTLPPSIETSKTFLPTDRP